MIIKGRSCSHFVLIGAVLLGGCSGEDPPDEEDPRCTEDFAPEAAPNRGASRFVAAINVVDSRVFMKDADDVLTDVRIGRITGSFLDYDGTGTGTAAMALALGARCQGIVSRPGPLSPSPVGVDRFVVEGTGRGTIEVPESAVGKHISIGDPVNEGATRLTAKVMSSAGGFTPFEVGIDAAMPLTVSEPVSDGTGEVVRAGLRVRWNEANGEAVVIVITPLSTDPIQSGGQIICQVLDDGCFDVPAAATTFLLSSNVGTYNMIVSRVRSDGTMVDQDTYVGMTSASEWHADLENGVFE